MSAPPFPEGNAIVHCEGAFQSTRGRFAHALVRCSRRYNVMAVIDSTCCGCDSGELLDGEPNDIPIVANLDEAIAHAHTQRFPATHFLISSAGGGQLNSAARHAIVGAIRKGLNVDNALFTPIASDSALTCVAAGSGRVKLRDIRNPPACDDLHTFSGKIDDVTSSRIAVLGTDAAVGKSTTAWQLVDALDAAGFPTELIDTGPTAWMQGADYCTVLDSLPYHAVASELEHTVWSAWQDRHSEFLVIEGQSSLLHPIAPRGHEILAATRPDCVILQHAPSRLEYDGCPGHELDPLDEQIEAIERQFDCDVIAIAINHEGLPQDDIPDICLEIKARTGLPAIDVLHSGADRLADVVIEHCGKTVVTLARITHRIDEQRASCGGK